MNKIFNLTNTIIISNIIFYIIQNIVEQGSIVFGLNHLFLTQNFYHQIFTTMFVHANLLHITMNMIVLFQFGTMIESAIGKIRFIIIYLIGGLLTSLLSFAYIYYFEQNANIVGASGAISVLLGYFALKVKTQRNGIIIWILLISFAPLLLGMNIAWYSHIIGFILGILLGLII
jgi:membrane associated rhomboid family serine protease